MSPTLWFGIVIIVCVLELLRIGMTTYVLLHLLQSGPLRRPSEDGRRASRSLRTARSRARREALLDPTLVALRAAMDEIALDRCGPSIDAAITALDRYAAALVQEHAAR